MKSREEWENNIQQNQGFEYLLVEKESNIVVAATKSSEITELMPAYQSVLANDSSLTIQRDTDPNDFVIIQGPSAWSKILNQDSQKPKGPSQGRV